MARRPRTTGTTTSGDHRAVCRSPATNAFEVRRQPTRRYCYVASLLVPYSSGGWCGDDGGFLLVFVLDCVVSGGGLEESRGFTQPLQLSDFRRPSDMLAFTPPSSQEEMMVGLDGNAGGPGGMTALMLSVMEGDGLDSEEPLPMHRGTLRNALFCSTNSETY